MNFSEELDRDVAELLQKTGELAVQQARGTQLFHTSDAFRDAIITKPVSNTKQVVWSQAPYSSYLEYGNNQKGPYIYPTSAKVLSFFQNGSLVFYRKVKSHGPLPYMQPALEAAENAIPQLWDQIRKSNG